MHRVINPPSQTPFLVCLSLLFLLFSSLFSFSSSLRPMKADGSTITIVPKPKCPKHCAGSNVKIHFPFGIGADCFPDPWFEIRCNASTNKPFLPSLNNSEVIEITIPDYNNGWLQGLTVGVRPFKACGAHNTKQFSVDLRGSPFNFSTDLNEFVMEGCEGSTLLTDQAINKPLTGCSTVCRNKTEITIGKVSTSTSSDKCYGDVSECCRMDLPSETSYPGPNMDVYYPVSSLQFYKIDLYGGQSSDENSNCLAATLIKRDSVEQYIGKLSTSNQYQVPIVPVQLYWSWTIEARPEPKHNARCWRDETANITNCRCNGNSVGNPYVENGCQDKCKNCHGFCTWKEEKSSYYCQDDNFSPLFFIPTIIASPLTKGLVAIAIVFGCRWLFRIIKRRKKTYRRVKIFKLKLQQHQSSNEGVVKRTKLFTHKKLDKATNHFNDNQILGRGGQGTVYKGMLTDGTIVAIKKSSKLEGESQMEQFINEVVILSTVNHRNVVKLLGCCLETKVPLLVYEFISNGTLSQHIHHPSEDFVLTWAMRLKIAADSAGAIAYLHSSSSTPVYHRDIKPANILLDDRFRAKVSDFGSSKTIEIDQTHLTTLVQGTLGYLDPEYFETSIFTDKSDVYSFGVMLLELLTSRKLIYRDETMEQKVLVIEFFVHERNSRLLELFDPEVVNEANEKELVSVAGLAKSCLNGSGRLRPSMKEVALTLEMIIKSQAEDQQTSPNERFSEIFMPEMTEIDIMSCATSYQIGPRAA